MTDHPVIKIPAHGVVNSARWAASDNQRLTIGSGNLRLSISLQVSILAIKKELECFIGPTRQRRRRRGKAAAGACSFCGKPGGDSLRLVAGPGVYICAECVGLCNEILAEDTAGTAGEGGPRA